MPSGPASACPKPRLAVELLAQLAPGGGTAGVSERCAPTSGRERLLRDLRRYLEQQQDGTGVVPGRRDARPAAGPSQLEARRNRVRAAADRGPNCAGRGRAAARRGRPHHTRRPPPRPARRRLRRDCAAFVADTLARIARHAEAQPAAASRPMIFAPGDERGEPPRLDRAAKERGAGRAGGRGGSLHRSASCTGAAPRPCSARATPTPSWSSSARRRAGTRTCRASPSWAAAGSCSTEILEAIGFARERRLHLQHPQVPPAQQPRPRSADEVAACEPYLQRQLDIIQPRGHLLPGAHRRPDPAGHQRPP